MLSVSQKTVLFFLVGWILWTMTAESPSQVWQTSRADWELQCAFSTYSKCIEQLDDVADQFLADVKRVTSTGALQELAIERSRVGGNRERIMVLRKQDGEMLKVIQMLCLPDKINPESFRKAQ